MCSTSELTAPVLIIANSLVGPHFVTIMKRLGLETYKEERVAQLAPWKAENPVSVAPVLVRALRAALHHDGLHHEERFGGRGSQHTADKKPNQFIQEEHSQLTTPGVLSVPFEGSAHPL